MEQTKRITFENDKQFYLMGKHIEFLIRFAKDISDARNIIHVYEANPSTNTFYFLYLTDQEVQLRFVKRDDIKQLQDIDDLNQSEILKKSNVHVYKGKKYFFQIIQKIDKKFLPRVNECLIGFTFEGNEKPTILFELTTEDRMNKFFDKMNEAIKKSKQYIKKHEINYLGLEQNIRRIVDKILLNSYPKKEVYNRILAKMNEKNYKLGIEQNRMLILALVGNSQQMQNFLRKQKIQAYDLQKKKYQHFLKEQALTNVTGALEPSSQHIVEGYSEKRKLDGIVIKKLTKAEHKDLSYKAHQQLFHDQIPFRSQIQIDELIGIEVLNSGKIQDQIVVKNINTDNQQVQPLRIPVRETNYSIICNDNDQLIKRDNASAPEYFNENVEGVAVEAVKFMYQLMKVNAKQKAYRQVIEGPFDNILELVKDILTQCQKKDDKRMQQNKSIIEMLSKARENYLKYRKNSIKYY